MTQLQHAKLEARLAKGLRHARQDRPSGPSAASSLQRLAGNRAVTSLLRPHDSRRPDRARREHVDALTPTQIANLQRLVGNAAVNDLLGRGGGPQGDVVQRKKGAKNTVTATDIVDEHKKHKHVGNFAAPPSTDAPTEFQVTVAASIEVPEYLQFAKTRMKSTIRNKVREGVRQVPGAKSIIRSPKTNQKIKEKAAVKAAGKAPGTDPSDPAVAHIVNNSDAVGHSWVKMSPVGASGPVQTYSFGFIPANGAAHGPQQAVPGYVRNPDLEFETVGSNIYLTTKVSAASYMKALAKIADLTANTPAYMTIGYNCTQFTKDIARAAGATFPGKAGMLIPVSDRGFMKRALSPNALSAKLGKDKGAETTSTERDQLSDPSGKYSYDDYSGISERRIPIYSPPKGLEIFDPFGDDPEGTITVEADEEVIPTGTQFSGSIQVNYGGHAFYATSEAALLRHLQNQTPKSRSIHKLHGPLRITTRAGERTVNSNSDVMVRDSDGDNVNVETPRPNVLMGSCEVLNFWKAVGGLT